MSEAVDAMTAMAVPGIAADRELTRTALRTSLVKDRRDEGTFDWVFDRFFRLLRVSGPDSADHGHAHDDLHDGGTLDTFTLSEAPGDTPQQGHSHGPPDDIAQYFDPADLGAQYDDGGGAGLTPDEIAALRGRLAGLIDRLPAALRRHLETLLASAVELESRGLRAAAADRDRRGERERAALEEAVRRLLLSVHGAPRPRRAIAARGSVDAARTMRANMGFDGVPFRPVTIAKVADRPRPGGGLLDVDADSDYGTALGSFLADHGSAVSRRTTLIVLGDGRGNGKEPNVGAFAELARRARETIWLTPEPRYSWGLGQCDLPGYAAHCDRVYVVRDLRSLERVSTLEATLAR